MPLTIENCKYTVSDIDKILNFTTWSAQKKIDTLLHMDCDMYCNLGIESPKFEVKDVKQKSKVIYRTIKKIDDAIGKSLLHNLD